MILFHYFMVFLIFYYNDIKALIPFQLLLHRLLIEALFGLLIYYIFKNKNFSKFQKNVFKNYNTDLNFFISKVSRYTN